MAVPPTEVAVTNLEVYAKAGAGYTSGELRSKNAAVTPPIDFYRIDLTSFFGDLKLSSNESSK